MKVKFLRCSRCGNIVEVVKESGVPMMCCGKPMEEIIPGTVEASVEKHIPVYNVVDNNVEVVVGSVEHPMQDVHYIEWVVLKTNLGTQKKFLQPNELPKVSFKLADNEVVEEVYAYCNLHGLWKA